MKELTIEEKAQRYDEALKVAKGLYAKDAPDSLHLERMFPILKESEDDKVRKKLIHLVKKSHEQGGYALHKWESDEMLAWLEKQDKKKSIDDLTQQEAMDIAVAKCFEWDKQKPADNVEPKFKIGDVIVEIKPNGYCQPVRVKYVGKESYSCESDDGKRFLSFPIINQDDYELVEQNPAWSEEDEQYLLVCKNALAKYQVSDKWDANIISRWLENRLKSLKPQSAWKPSVAQLNALSIVSKGYVSDDIEAIVSLYNDLKKLKGE